MSGKAIAPVIAIAAAIVVAVAWPAAAADEAPRATTPPGQYLSFGYTLSDEPAVDGLDGATLASKETRVAAGLLLAGDTTRGVDLGIDYEYTRYTYDSVESRNRDLHRLQLPIGVRADAGRWRLDAMVAPGIATSSNVFQEAWDMASSDDYFATAELEATLPTGNTASWLVGLAWDRSFGTPRVYPVFGWNYTPTAKFAARIAFPDPSLRFEATERQTWTIRLYPAGFEWRVLDDDLVTEFDYSVEAWRAEAWWSVRAWRSIFVDLSAGYEFGRHHAFTDRNGTRIDRDVGDALLITVGLRWRNGPLAPTNRVARSHGR